jgi:7-dehydrocholesterol reductase
MRRNNKRNASSSSDPSSSRLTSSDPWFGAFSSPFDRFIRTILGPFLLLIVTPLFVNIAALAALQYQSSLVTLFLSYDSLRALFLAAFPLPSIHIIFAFITFVCFETFLLITIPGRVFLGAVSPSGFLPSFRANGGVSFIITVITSILLVFNGIIDATVIYDNALEILTLLNGSALLLAIVLAIKGVIAPSTRDAGIENGPIFAIYWGVELYPAIFNLQLKQLLISRIGMMSWFLTTASFAAASIRAHSGVVTPALFASAGLNLLYVSKFFLFFEADYLRAADIAVDRMGFMLIWGPLCFMPLVHNLQTAHLVTHTGLPLSWVGAIAWVTIGVIAIAVNLDADTQRHHVRAALGKCNVWSKPATFIRALYRDASGVQHENLLLTCGWHGYVRHFHYLPDILLLILYCSPAGFDAPLPWTYFFYLSSLLIDRCLRIDARCAAKYGVAWEKYQSLVPWRLIPYVW